MSPFFGPYQLGGTYGTSGVETFRKLLESKYPGLKNFTSYVGPGGGGTNAVGFTHNQSGLIPSGTSTFADLMNVPVIEGATGPVESVTAQLATGGVAGSSSSSQPRVGPDTQFRVPQVFTGPPTTVSPMGSVGWGGDGVMGDAGPTGTPSTGGTSTGIGIPSGLANAISNAISFTSDVNANSPVGRAAGAIGLNPALTATGFNIAAPLGLGLLNTALGLALPAPQANTATIQGLNNAVNTLTSIVSRGMGIDSDSSGATSGPVGVSGIGDSGPIGDAGGGAGPGPTGDASGGSTGPGSGQAGQGGVGDAGTGGPGPGPGGSAGGDGGGGGGGK